MHSLKPEKEYAGIDEWMDDLRLYVLFQSISVI